MKGFTEIFRREKINIAGFSTIGFDRINDDDLIVFTEEFKRFKSTE